MKQATFSDHESVAVVVTKQRLLFLFGLFEMPKFCDHHYTVLKTASIH